MYRQRRLNANDLVAFDVQLIQQRVVTLPPPAQQTHRDYTLLPSAVSSNRERKCADIIGTVPVLWAGRFQCYTINIIFQ